MAYKTHIEKVYIVQDGSNFCVRVKTKIEDTCLCVCNGKLEAEVYVAMILATAWNTTSQSVRNIAESKLAGFFDVLNNRRLIHKMELTNANR